MLVGYKLVCKIWVTLQTQYKGTGAVFNYNTIKSYIKIKYNNYPNLKYFIIFAPSEQIKPPRFPKDSHSATYSSQSNFNSHFPS